MEKDKPSERRSSWIMRWFQRWFCGRRSHTVTQEDRTGHHSDDQKHCDSVVIPEERTLSLQAESNMYDALWTALARYRESSHWPGHNEEVASPSTINNIGVMLRSCGDEIPSPKIPVISKLEEIYDLLKGSFSSEEKPLVPSLVTNLGSGIQTDCKYNQFLGPGGNVDVELTDESGNRYSIHLPAAGSYLWLAAGLGFVVRAAVTLQVAFASWDPHLAPVLQDHERWMAAGPLFDVAAEPGEAVAEIHLPHFISLQGEVDVAWFQVAHFKEEGMILEQPARVEPFHAVLENPSFSLMGVLLRIASGTRLSVPITSSTLVYYHAHPEDSKFHLYLIPSDSLLRKAIDEEEAKFQGMRLQTSPPLEPLNFASRYIVSCSAQLEIIPEEMKLSSRGPREIHHFTKIYAGQMKEQIQLEITDKRHGNLVWKTLVKPVDLQFGAASAPPTFSGAAFVKENLRHLQARMGDLGGVLDDLQDSKVLTEDEKELVEQAQTRQRRNETLLRFLRNKGDQALEKLCRSLHERDPYLMSYLRQPSLSQ